MIEIVTGTIEEQIIKLLQRIYPITIDDINVNEMYYYKKDNDSDLLIYK